MNTLARILFFSLITLSTWPGKVLAEGTSASEPQPRYLPVTATVIPGLGFNGFDDGNVVNHFSLGLVASRAGWVDGLAVSSVANWADHRVRGIQLAGAANVSGALTGLQLAGAFNLAHGPAGGAQLSGAANVASTSMRGLQVSGGVNLADQLRGLQFSVLNLGGDVDGVQLGVINIARKVKGLQLGVVNVSSEMYGAPVGLVSVAGNGQLHLQAWASEVAPTHLTLKYGSKYIYSLATVGFELQRDRRERRWLAGLGIGGHVPLGRFYVDLDATAMNANQSFFTGSETALLSQLRLLAGYQLARHLSVFGGLTANTLVDWGDRTWAENQGLGLRYELGSSRSRVALWPGLAAGLQL